MPHERFQTNVPRGNGVHIDTRANSRKATSTLVHFMQQLAPRSSIKAEPRIVQVLRRTKTVCESSGKVPFHAYVCLARRTNCTHSAMAGDDGFLMNSGLAAACEASVKDQCQLNDSVAAYRHGPLLLQNPSQFSDRPVLIWVAVASPMAARPAVAHRPHATSGGS